MCDESGDDEAYVKVSLLSSYFSLFFFFSFRSLFALFSLSLRGLFTLFHPLSHPWCSLTHTVRKIVDLFSLATKIVVFCSHFGDVTFQWDQIYSISLFKIHNKLPTTAMATELRTLAVRRSWPVSVLSILRIIWLFFVCLFRWLRNFLYNEENMCEEDCNNKKK